MKWFKGQLHVHSYWSDGRAFPEQVVAAYKGRGYDFLCMTEHNRFADDPDKWREVMQEEGGWPPEISNAVLDAYFDEFGANWVETRRDGQKCAVRLKTYDEIKRKFEESGKFLLLPGIELTQENNGVNPHVNYINLSLIPPCVEGGDMVKNINGAKTTNEVIALNYREGVEIAEKQKAPYMVVLNHPFWRYYDITPQALIDCPEIRFFEICNSGSDFAPHAMAAGYTVDKFWDIVNAFRRMQGHQLLYGVGGDDAHFYDPARINGDGGVGDAWVMVKAEALTAESLISAMRCGEFYASNGVYLENITFSGKNNTLKVKVVAEQGVNYQIRFITTKQGFSTKMSEIKSPGENKRPERVIPLYSDDIGRTVRTVRGTEGEYRMEPDDLYVRAVVESDVPGQVQIHLHPKMQTAWTQPYCFDM